LPCREDLRGRLRPVLRLHPVLPAGLHLPGLPSGLLHLLVPSRHRSRNRLHMRVLPLPQVQDQAPSKKSSDRSSSYSSSAVATDHTPVATDHTPHHSCGARFEFGSPLLLTSGKTF